MEARLLVLINDKSREPETTVILNEMVKGTANVFVLRREQKFLLL